MGTVGVRARRDFAGLERRRLEAARQFAKAKGRAEGRGIFASMARALHVSRESVRRWYRLWMQGGVDALRGAGRAGRMPRLNQDHLARVDYALRRGARANGFSTDLWTLPRVAQVIERVTGVHYHPGHVWRVLRAMGWTLQRPARRARERNEDAIRQWIAERWPAVKKKPAATTRGSPSRTKAASPSSHPSAARGPRGAKPRS